MKAVTIISVSNYILSAEEEMLAMDAQNTKAKTFSSRIAYSFGAFGHDMFYGMLSTYFMMFVTGHLFNSNAGGEAARMVSFITLTIMVLRIAELVIDPFIGNIIDKTDTK